MTSSQNGFHGYQWVHMRSSFVIVIVALYFWVFNGSFTWCDFSECDCIFTARKRSLRRLCFYRCLSVHRWACVVGACMAGGRVWQGACMTGEGRCVVGGMRGIRWDTVNERAVRILLECILVYIAWSGLYGCQWYYSDSATVIFSNLIQKGSRTHKKCTVWMGLKVWLQGVVATAIWFSQMIGCMGFIVTVAIAQCEH